jgi:Cu/Ag efflux protein CusF
MGHGAVSQVPVDHSKMDHSKMDHGSTPARSDSPATAPKSAQAAHVEGIGTVNSVDAAGHKVNLNHNPIPVIGWPAMTMDFAVAPSVDLRALKPGTRVNFMMQRGGDGMYVIHSITPSGGQ